jgi:broad specificity phosphatase PhoE
MLYLIRHAHAGSKKAWDGPDEVRPLSAQGLLQATALVGMLAGHPVSHILSSPTSRCRATVEPLAADRGLAVRDEPDLAVGAPVERVERLLREVAGADAVLCTHGETIADLFQRLDGTIDLGEHPRWQKGSVWLLDGFNGRSPRAAYLPPVPAGD